MRRNVIVAASALASVLLLPPALAMAAGGEKCDGVYGSGPHRFSLATGSPGELGMLEVLGEAFAKANHATLCWTKAGSGKSLKLLQDKKVDMIMVHAPAAEKNAVEEGWAVKRTLIGSNEFFIVGPARDPAGLSAAASPANSAEDAYARIARAGAKFFSRGDNSGTHKKEMEIWKKAGIEPSGPWYVVTKAFMTATLRRANDEQGYFMTDSSTWVAERKSVPRLEVLFRGDRFLVNTYHALAQPAGATAGAATAAKFIDFVASPGGQAMIRDFGKDLHGKGLYDDAAYAAQYEK
jgi:tungstate transport system substrate-binding protein